MRADKVGVVLMNEGGAVCADDVEDVLYRQLMSSNRTPIPVHAFLRTRIARLLARFRGARARVGYEQIGGTCPQNQRTQEQARKLHARLNDRFGISLGVQFRTYVAALRADGGFACTLERMRQDGIDRVILLPMYPQSGESTTAMMLRNWRAAEVAQGLSPRLLTSVVPPFGERPGFIQAVSERIDEALQRFPPHVRESVPLVFSAPAMPLRDLKKHRDPFCTHVHATARAIMAYRSSVDRGRPSHVAFQKRDGIGRPLSPTLEDRLEQLADDGNAAVLIVPVGTVSDHVGTLYGLDIELREKATEMGFERFEVTNGLNAHALFVDALADSVSEQLRSAPVQSREEAVSVPKAREAGISGIEMLLASELASAHNRSKAA